MNWRGPCSLRLRAALVFAVAGRAGAQTVSVMTRTCRTRRLPPATVRPPACNAAPRRDGRARNAAIAAARSVAVCRLSAKRITLRRYQRSACDRPSRTARNACRSANSSSASSRTWRGASRVANHAQRRGGPCGSLIPRAVRTRCSFWLRAMRVTSTKEWRRTRARQQRTRTSAHRPVRLQTTLTRELVTARARRPRP